MKTEHIIILAIAGVVALLTILLTANSRLMRLFKKYDNIISKSGFSTQEFLMAARDTLNVDKLSFARIKGHLTDCYIPKKRVIALSDSTYNNRSVAAITVASHEFGHALQHDKTPLLFNFVRALGYIFRMFSKLVLPAVLIAVILLCFVTTRNTGIIILWCSLGVVASGFLFRVLTIPVEYDASRRAKNLLQEYNVFDQDELKKARRIFRAAAFTYVADFISTSIGLNFIRRKLMK